MCLLSRVSGLVVFLDVASDDILKRLAQMKVSRIVGQEDNVPMDDILAYRQQFYECCYDVRVLCEENEAPESITAKVADALLAYHTTGSFVSTRGYASKERFNDVVLKGLAPDGGLFVPNSIPSLTLKQWQRMIGMPYSELARRVLETWIHPSDIHPAANLREMTSQAYSADNFGSSNCFPVVHLERNLYMSELFHGPTASFKDAALQIMPRFFRHAQLQTLNESTALTTSK